MKSEEDFLIISNSQTLASESSLVDLDFEDPHLIQCQFPYQTHSASYTGTAFWGRRPLLILRLQVDENLGSFKASLKA